MLQLLKSSAVQFCLVAGLVAFAPMAIAGGGSVVGNGGGSLVCFNGNPAKYVEEGLMKPAGERNLTSAVALEYFIEAATGDVDPQFKNLSQGLNSAAVSSYLSARINSVPEFAAQFYYAFQRVIRVDMALDDLISPDYHDTHDWSSPVVFPPNCTRVQTAVRFNSMVYFESSIWRHLSVNQQIIIQYHEYLYYTSSLFYGMQTSRPTQDVLTYLISKKFSPAGFRAKLKQVGFDVKAVPPK